MIGAKVDYFNESVQQKLQKAIKSEDNFNLIVLHGESGRGKTYIAHKVLEEKKISVNDIVFSNESFFPCGLMSDEEWIDSDENVILACCTEKIQDEQCLLFQNMEYCNLDYKNLFGRLFQFCKVNDSRVIAILEYNSNNVPDDVICKLTNKKIEVGPQIADKFKNFLEMNFHHNPLNNELFEKIIRISNGNIRTFYNALNILQHLNIINKRNSGKYEYINTDFSIPDNFLALQIKLFDTLEKYEKEPLLSAAPFSVNIYDKLLIGVFSEFNNLNKYLDILSQYKSIITSNDNVFSTTELFKSSYVFLDSETKDAIQTRLDKNEINKKIDAYYMYFDRIYQNRSYFDSLKETDKILLLSNLSKSRKHNISSNQVKYFVDLMGYYQKHFLYRNVIEQATLVLRSKELTITQINKENHFFWTIYFNALIAVGKYKYVIEYKDKFEDGDLNYLIAKAFYYNGEPKEALFILENKIHDQNNTQFNIGLKYSMMASIYDWLGNNKKSAGFFKLAAKHCETDELKYQLYKKYSQQIEFEVPECQKKMKEAIDFYKNKNLKDYAECLHNFGTGCIFVYNYKEAERKLKLSCNVLRKICSNEIYYPLNSLGILYSYHNSQYKKAISLWESALKFNINEKFCKAAIINNMITIYIKIGNYEKAKEKLIFLEEEFNNLNCFMNVNSNDRLDMQHQFRQYYYNCALLSKAKEELHEALNYFYEAQKSSTYNSNIVYSINKNIQELETRLNIKNQFFKKHILKVEEPTPTEKYMYEKDMYLCEIMFWG